MSGIGRFSTYGGSALITRRVAGRIRVVARRFQNDDGWWPWDGIIDFTAIADILNGTEDQLAFRLNAYARDGRSIVIVMGNLGWDPPLRVDYRAPGYWDALERVRQMCQDRGLYLCLRCFGAAEMFNNQDEYRTVTRRYADWAKMHPSVVLRLANEPYKNGWTNADDPRLLELADIVATILGHRDFAVGDPWDENSDVLVRVSRVANIAVTHPSRQEDEARYRRWVDHLKEAADLMVMLAPGATLVLDEPMGAGTRQMGKRDDDPDAHLAAMVVARTCGVGYSYMWIPAEHAFTADALPGLETFGMLAGVLPVSPDWHFSNSEPVASINWAGLPGKTRNMVRGGEAFTVAYGNADWGSLLWTSGWHGVTLFAGPRIRVSAVSR